MYFATKGSPSVVRIEGFLHRSIQDDDGNLRCPQGQGESMYMGMGGTCPFLTISFIHMTMSCVRPTAKAGTMILLRCATACSMRAQAFCVACSAVSLCARSQ